MSLGGFYNFTNANFGHEPTTSRKETWKSEFERSPEAVEITEHQFGIIHKKNMEDDRFKVCREIIKIN